MSLLDEIKRRKVFQVAAMYAVVAWLLVQVAVAVEVPLSLPDWFDTAVIVLVALGFPVAVILAWAFELTPVGIKRTIVAGPTAAQPAVQLALTALVAACLGAVSAWFLLRAPERDWLFEQAIPVVESHIGSGDWERAYRAIREARAVAPDEPALQELTPRYAWTVSISSEPDGATVYRRPYDSDPDAWEELGTTSLENIEIPFGLSRLRLERDGFRPVDRTIGGGVLVATALGGTDPFSNNFQIGTQRYRLDATDTLDEGHVRVPGWTADVLGQRTEFNDFFLGRYEVTNEEFKEFVDAGGYRQPNLWSEPFVLNGREIGFDEAMARFVDGTGRPGPSTWEAGDYAEGQGRFPVAGVSWYEAAAFARFRGEELPTVHHWRRALAPGAFTWTLPASNLDGDALRPVGDGDAMSWVGAYDLLGNVREWTVNPRGEQRAVLGGGANDPYFLAMQTNVFVSPWDRSAFNGLRTMRAADDPAVMARARAAPPEPSAPPAHEPVTDEVYAAYSRVFAYNRTGLDARVEDAETTRNWVRERITFNAAYGGERMVLYLYLPTTGNPPYQTVVYWPGSAAFNVRSIDDYTMHLDYVVKNGRAVAFPVYEGTFERGDGSPVPPFGTPEYRENLIRGVNDLRRSVDYLETRADIDTDALAFYGHSWGTVNGASALAQEPRLTTAVIYAGFLRSLEPEVDPLNALPRVRIPVLMLSGEFDPVVPLREAERYFAAIGTPEPDKRHVVEPGGHFVPRDVLIREVLSWLDEQLGPPYRPR